MKKIPFFALGLFAFVIVALLWTKKTLDQTDAEGKPSADALAQFRAEHPIAAKIDDLKQLRRQLRSTP